MHQNFCSSDDALKLFFIMRQKFSALHYAGRCVEILAQSACYAGHVNSIMDFPSLGQH